MIPNVSLVISPMCVITFSKGNIFSSTKDDLQFICSGFVSLCVRSWPIPNGPLTHVSSLTLALLVKWPVLWLIRGHEW